MATLTLDDGTWTLANVTETRTVDVSDTTIDQLADLLGTLIYDLRTDAFDADNYNVTGGSIDRAYDADESTANELGDVLHTVLTTDSVGEVPSQVNMTVTNGATDRTLDADDTTMDELLDVLFTILTEEMRVNVTAIDAHATLAGAQATAYTLSGSSASAYTLTGAQADAYTLEGVAV